MKMYSPSLCVWLEIKNTLACCLSFSQYLLIDIAVEEIGLSLYKGYPDAVTKNKSRREWQNNTKLYTY